MKKAVILLLTLGAVAIIVTVMFSSLFADLAGTRRLDAKLLPARWSPEIIQLASRLPVQQEGRIKPLSTQAGFAMLGIVGKRNLHLSLQGSEKSRDISPVEWALDCFFYPEVAKKYPVFLVNDADTIKALGLNAHTKNTEDGANNLEEKRGRYSFEELEPARETLVKLAGEITKEDKTTGKPVLAPENRSPMQDEIVTLATNMRDFDQLTGTLAFAHEMNGTPGEDGKPGPSISGLMERMITSKMVFPPEYILEPQSIQSEPTLAPLADTLLRLRDLAARSQTIHLYPSPEPDQKAWMSFGHLIFGGLTRENFQSFSLAAITEWEELVRLRDDRDKFTAKLKTLVEARVAGATSRGDYRSVPTELRLQKIDPVYKSLLCFISAFLLLAVTWFAPAAVWSVWTKKIAAAVVVAGWLILVTGIAHRCYIMQNAPVTNLYETMLFIGAGGVMLGFLAERLLKNGLLLALTAFYGTLLMFLAYKFETTEGTDNLRSLQAVLNTNFWLSTHVTSVTIGYVPGLLAALISLVYIVARLFDPGREDAAQYKSLTTAVYGIISFGLHYSTVGTILGGIWANYSWGRFWGWDPKENGALMIVLWYLIILHARMGGYIREYGLHLATTIGGMIVAFSWFHVNLLGVGLHAYGFTSGVKRALFIYYGFQSFVLILGFIGWALARKSEAGPKKDESAAPVAPPLAS